MKQDEYSKLRNSLGVDDLDKKTKKKLLDDFKKIGGKIDETVFNSKAAYLDLVKNAMKNNRKRSLDNDNLVKLKKQRIKERELENKKGSTKNQIVYDKKRKSSPNKSKDNSLDMIDFSKPIKKNKNISKKVKKSDIKEQARSKMEKKGIHNPNLSTSRIPKRKSKKGIGDKFMFSINGFFFKITMLNYTKLNPYFVISFMPYYLNIVTQLGYFVRSCIQTSSIRRIIKNKTKKADPFILDMLYHFHQIMNEDFLREFQEYVVSNQSVEIFNDNLRSQFISYFRKIYFLFKNENLVTRSLLYSLSIYKELYNTSLNEDFIISSTKFLLQNAVRRFHYIFCLNINKYISLNNIRFDSVVKLGNEESLGYYLRKLEEEEARIKRKLKEFEEEQKDVIEKDVEKKEQEKIPDDVKKGFFIMDEVDEYYSVHWDRLISKNPLLSTFEKNDKILPIYALFLEFVNEYSIFLPSKNIRYKIDYVEHKKVDVKDLINDGLNYFTILMNEFKTYSSLVKKIKRASEGISSTYSSKLKNEQLIMSNKIRNKLIEGLHHLLKPIALVIKDYKEENQKLIDNIEEKIYIDTKLMGTKKFNKKKIIFLFVQSYYFIKAFLYRLEKTDLSGMDIYMEDVFPNRKE